MADDSRTLTDHQWEIIDQAAREWTAEFPLTKIEPPPLYHYTNAAGLLGIVENQSLWASAIGYSNDLREIKCAYDIAEPHMEELAASRHFDHPSQRSLMRSLQGFFGDSEHPPQDGYSVSFCARNDLLSQWRAYGEQGGFSIEFHPLTQMNAILQAPVPVFTSVAGRRILLRPVEYDPEKQSREFRDKMERVLQLRKRLSESNESHEFAAAIVTLAAMWLVEWIYTVKDVAFREEEEWRLICLPDMHWAFSGQSVYGHPESVKTRIRGAGIVPYVELKRGNGILPIRSIICGPAQHPELNRRAVELLLKSKSYQCEVRNSCVPLRTYR